MVYLAVDAATGESVAVGARGIRRRCSSPPTDRSTQLDVGGLALGVEPGQTYEETSRDTWNAAARSSSTPTASVEARRDGELYGVERLIESARRLANSRRPRSRDAVIDDCRAFAGDLADDCALVVIKR